MPWVARGLRPVVKLEIWSDVVCPWCAIGRARLQAALSGFAHRDAVTLRWRSFELDPAAPREQPGDRAEHLAAKYGVSVAAARRMEGQVTATAAADGLEFRFDRARHGNTADAHRLLHHAWETGGATVQDELKGRLLRASFTDGEPIGDPEALVRIAVGAGLDEDGVRAVLGSDRHLDDVRADEDLARSLGITSVPFLVIDDRYGVAGAQPIEALREVLDTAWAEGAPARS
ncbi:putative DsbA family dithiol-disulfide isomerase [Pseudonocardia alni]|uniref:DsbA family dithiol-disulfide isomerase n=1 Tax=Pseudonocardia alni TaxID=33907 RepID=A0AA44UNF2_PSEA5|nr:putative DsbA family dithiol-disulfide isomerase [Pseudonocardia alni]